MKNEDNQIRAMAADLAEKYFGQPNSHGVALHEVTIAFLRGISGSDRHTRRTHVRTVARAAIQSVTARLNEEARQARWAKEQTTAINNGAKTEKPWLPGGTLTYSQHLHEAERHLEELAYDPAT